MTVFMIGQHPVSIYQVVFLAVIVAACFFLWLTGARFMTLFARKNNISRRFSRFVHQGWAVFLIAIGFVGIFEILKLDYTSFLQHVLIKTDNFRVKVYDLFLIILTIFFIRIVIFILEYLMDLRIRHEKIDKGRGRSLLQIVKYVIWILGVTICLGSMGLKTTFIIASVSALLVGVGFGLQHIFNDFFSGIIILFDGSIEVDDVVELDNVVGRVTDIGLRVSKIRTRDNFIIIVPNSQLTGDKVINWTHNEKVTRFHVNVGVAYGSDVRLVEKVLMEVASKHDQIRQIPAPFVRFNDFGDSALAFQLYFWTANDFLVENIKSDLRFDIDDQFRIHNIRIPFPQRDIHLFKDEKTI